VLRRILDADLSAAAPAALPPQFAALCPRDGRAFPEGSGVPLESLLLFDLETTGLSGGAGTVAFLAAFGRFRPGAKLEIVQYLLLDYPGESEFIDAVLGEFSGDPVLVTYNGKSFDSQILRTRCVMNGVFPPDPPHLDLVHPARRLWRRIFGSCSQVDVEEGILGVRREGDLPGSEAPDAWFEYLKTGNAGRLEAIADHNGRDIAGLAGILLRMAEIAADPVAAVDSGEKIDPEQLALVWLRSSAVLPDPHAAARALLERAAVRGFPRAAFALARELRKEAGVGAEGSQERAERLLQGVYGADGAAPALRAASCRILSREALRRADPVGAIFWLDAALALDPLAPSLREAVSRRRDRLAARFGFAPAPGTAPAGS
jgi:uncharacterized protein YprB with RNaseH-like and TPR domain